MLQYLEQQTRLTGNQRRIITAAVLGDMLEFFDYFLIGYVVAFIAGPWKLTFGESAVILLSSGFGAMFGAVFYGWLADKIGRRKVFLMTVINFSIATGILTFTPDNAWIFLSVFRFLIGFGVGGLYCVDLPLVQEFVPASKRGMVGGLVTAAVPIGVLMGAALGAFATPYVGWRGLFAIGMVPGLLTLLIRAWVPESPRWLIQMGRIEEARKSLAWALEMDPAALPMDAGAPEGQKQPMSRLSDIFRYPRSLAVSWITNLGAQTGYYGLTLWVPTLLVQLLGVTPARASFLLIFVNFAGLFGRVGLSYLSDAIGRKGVRRHRQFWRGDPDCCGRALPQRFFRNRIRVLASVDRKQRLRRRRLCDRRPVFRRSVARGAANHRHGLGLRIRRTWKSDRPAGARAHRGFLEHHHAEGVRRGAVAVVFLSRGVVRARGSRLHFHWNGNEGPLARNN